MDSRFEISLIKKSKNAFVMLVDDDEDFAKMYIPIWEKMCQVSFLYARDATTAIEILKKNPIKVVILDQIMPTPGTELFSQLKAVDNRIKTILLSAEMKEYFLDAPRIGFDYSLLKSSRDLDSLPKVVIGLLSTYNSEIKVKTIENLNDFYISQKQGFLFGPKYEVRYSILDYEVLEEEKVVGDWHTSVFLEVGQELSDEVVFDLEREFRFSDNFRIENESLLSISSDAFAEFKGSLALEIEKTFEDTYTEKVREVIQRKNKFSIPSDSPDILSRSYEYAKMAKVMKVYLMTKCSCCNCVSIEPITIMMPIPVISLRIVEHYKDNSKRIVDAGEIR